VIGSLRAGTPSLSKLLLPAGIVLVAGLNVGIGAGLAAGQTKLVVMIALLPVLFGVSSVIVTHRDWLVLAALLLTMVGDTLNRRLPGTGGTAIFPSDVFVALAVAGYLIERLTGPRDGHRPQLRTIVLSWPLAILAVGIMLGIFRGHNLYGTSYLSEPARIVVYAAIGTAMVSIEPRRLYRQLVKVFYLTTVIEAAIGAFNLVAGRSQTASASLSTGGTRSLALTTAMFLAGALVIALLNLELEPAGRGRVIHLVMASLALFGIVISLGRTTFAVVGLLVPLLLVSLRRLRRTMLAYTPILAALVVVTVVAVLQLSPSLGTTVAKRFTGHVGHDTAVVQRQRKYAAALKGFDAHQVFGFGFGRPVQFISVDGSVQTFSGDPENSYIYVLVGGGIFALSSLLFLIAVFFGDVLRRLRGAEGEERALIIFGASLAFILLVNTVSGPILTNPPLTLVLWIAMLLPALVRVPGREGSTYRRP
jgi:O-antigen ligase